tara:strand:+ start:4749 stop:5486 length:738 start_codon:yes stop_codon:yes gene_type:complete
MNNLNHIIFCRFNLQFKDKPITYEGNPCWLEKRLALFKKYCINAFINQTDPNFKLLLYCDNTTPDPYKSELLKLESQYDFIFICWDYSKAYGKGFTQTFKISILNNIKKLTPPGTKEIICSRYDCDDILEIRYNEFIKLAHQNYDIISLAKGLYWDVNTNQFLDSTFPTGPFVSVKSNLDNFLSPVEEEHHDYVRKKGGKPIITKENLWIQIIHGENVWNRLDRMPGKLIPPPSAEYLKTHFAYE